MSILECLAAAAESTMEVIVIQQSHELIAFRCNNNGNNNNNNNNNIIIKDTMLSHIPSNNFNEWHDPHVLVTKIHKYSSSIQCLYRPIQMYRLSVHKWFWVSSAVAHSASQRKGSSYGF